MIYSRQRKIRIVLAIAAGFLLAFVLWRYQYRLNLLLNPHEGVVNQTITPTPTPSLTESPSKVVDLNVPFISEAPENIWKNPWVNACEEASIAMVEKFYTGDTEVTVTEAKEFMQMLFDVQDRLYGSNINSDAARTTDLINNYSSYKGKMVINPTIEDIKNEIRAGRPVITLHHGGELKNKNVHFLASGSYYHMLVVKGFDDERGEFITHDDGDRITGVNHRYEYNLFMDSIHDYVEATSKTNGPATVIFTSRT